MNDIKILILQFEAKFPKNKFEFADISNLSEYDILKFK